MAQSGNRQGLTRPIPEDVKRQVRQNAGFGCVICGSALYHYEHVVPFTEVSSHKAGDITLLCANCHGEKERGFQLDVGAIRSAMSSPASKRRGYSSYGFRFRNTLPALKIGPTVVHCSIPVAIDGEHLLKFEFPEYDGGPFRLSGNFYNSTGSLALEIVQNDARTISSNFDVETKSGKIIIREKIGHIHLQLDCSSPDYIAIEKLHMYFKHLTFKLQNGVLFLKYPDGRVSSISNSIVSGMAVGLSIGSPPPGMVAGIIFPKIRS